MKWTSTYTWPIHCFIKTIIYICRFSLTWMSKCGKVWSTVRQQIWHWIKQKVKVSDTALYLIERGCQKEHACLIYIVTALSSILQKIWAKLKWGRSDWEKNIFLKKDVSPSLWLSSLQTKEGQWSSEFRRARKYFNVFQVYIWPSDHREDYRYCAV